MSNQHHPLAPPDRPGRSVEHCLLSLPEPDRLPFFNYVQQQARLNGDVEMQEAIRDYRLMQKGKPYLRVIPRPSTPGPGN